MLLGIAAWSVAYKFFLVPAGLYNGGFTGISQILQNLIVRITGQGTGFDLTGLFYWLINIPLLILGYRKIGRMFMIRTIIAVSVQSFLMTIIPSPAHPLLSDATMNCLIGGGLSGFGIGMVLRSGGSTGGTDILGLCVVQKNPEFSVGKLSMAINICIFVYAAVSYKFEIAAYSAAYSVVTAFTTDRIHYQNVKLTVFVVSKVPNLGSRLTREMVRGVTTWNGWGEYSHDIYQIHMIVMNKYELHHFRKLLNELDPEAFSWVVSPNLVMGNFISRMGV